MERKDVIAAVIAATGIMAAATIAGIAVIKVASPETTSIADDVNALTPTAVVLPELPAPPTQLPELPALVTNSGGSSPAITQPGNQAYVDEDSTPTKSQSPEYGEYAEEGEYAEVDEYEGEEHGAEHESGEHEGDESEYEGHDDDDD